QIYLYGSLAKTGVGHATDIAVQLGLAGHLPEMIDTAKISDYIFRIKAEQTISIQQRAITFQPKRDIIFNYTEQQPHPNTLIFKAFYENESVLESVFYSIGGGFIEEAGAGQAQTALVDLTFPIDRGRDLLNYTTNHLKQISEIVFANELCFRSQAEVEKQVAAIFTTMLECVFKGCHTEGILPGGLNVKRRAKRLANQLLPDAADDANKWLNAIKATPQTFNSINKWVSCFALAVNEQNAALGRVVTSPTNGAAGVIPAVLFYYYCFCEHEGMPDMQRFLLTAGEIGCLFKKGATISAAVGGCQAEIGVSSAMAAAGLTEVLGGTPEQVLMAAEIAMEHHLGLTCDPIGGLVQIPCIERNSMGAMKAITASNLALASDPEDAIVNFDTVVKTMWDTAVEMNSKYKETAEGGLAFNLPVILPEC
ncbi:MAG: L-serine ammonia-lyase, partial [Saprospiraceae bacterium]